MAEEEWGNIICMGKQLMKLLSVNKLTVIGQDQWNDETADSFESIAKDTLFKE